MFENFCCSSWDFRAVRSEGVGVEGDLGEDMACGSVGAASLRNVWATENWPSRIRCIAIARLVREGWAARTS